MPYHYLRQALIDLKNRMGIVSEITTKSSRKEGQCDDEEEEEERKMCELDAFKRQNAEVLEPLNRLHSKYHSLLENAITDYEEIEIYESYVEDLHSIIFKLIHHLNSFDSVITHEQNQVGSLHSTDLKQRDDSVTIINEMDLIPPPPFDNKLLDTPDNNTDTIDDEKKSDNLRHHLNDSDLQRRCQRQLEEYNELKIKKETADAEHKRFVKNCFESFQETIGKVDKAKDMGISTGDCLENLIQENVELKSELKNKNEEILKVQKSNIIDMEALIFEIADKHDHIASLRSKTRKLEERIEELERKVQFREKIIRELRRVPKSAHHDQKNTQLPITPPRTPELLKTSRSSADLMYSRNLYLTVPQIHNNNASGDSLYSLSDIEQESNVEKSASEVNFGCYDDDANKFEVERLQQSMSEIESENKCNRLLITKLEDELIMLRKCEARNKQDRNLKTDKLNLLSYKIKSMASKVLAKSGDEKPQKPKLHHDDLSIIEDDLKGEFDALNGLIKLVTKTKSNLELISSENQELHSTIEALKSEIMELRTPVFNVVHPKMESDSQIEQLIISNCESVSTKHIARVLSRLIGKEITPEAISEITSSSPDIGGSGDSSLSNGHPSLSDIINDWKRELDEKNCELRHKSAINNSLEERLQEKDMELSEMRSECKSAQTERDKNCQMVHQLKEAIQYHNESIQFLKHQNAEFKSELDDKKTKLTHQRNCYDEMKKRNLELEDEIQHSNDVEAINLSIKMLNEQFYKENMQKDDQLNRLRDANLQLRSQIFELNQDVVDLMEIVEIQKNRRSLENFKLAQKEEQQQIEKEISNRERDINCLKHYRSRCAEIESEYLEKMASQKLKSDTTIKELECEITALTEQLIQSHQQTTHHDELMQQTAILQNSMQELECQNDILRKTIESYESRFGELQVNLEKVQFENNNLILEIDNLKSDINDKNKRLAELSLDQQRVETEYEIQKKSCTCTASKNSPTRSSSTVMQMNELKTKLMNKSMESSKATEALKRKVQQYEKLQKTAFEEKSRLREECLKSIQTIGELKSKISLLEIRLQEQNEEVMMSRDKATQAIARMSAIESELSSKRAKLEDLETREEKWRVHAYEITHEIKSRKEDAFKREQKLMQELHEKENLMKDQSRMILQNENTLHHLRGENDTLKTVNSSLNQQLSDLKNQLEDFKSKENGLSELLDKTEEELKSIKSEVFQLFNTSAVSEIKNVHGQMRTENVDLHTRYQNLVEDFNKLLEENRTLYEIKKDTVSAIEIFKKLQSESAEREKTYQIHIAKLQSDKKNLHMDRTRLTKQLLEKHRDMIILNSEIDKFRHSDDFESQSSSQFNSMPFQPVFYPSAIASLARSTSNPDLASDPIAVDARNLTEKMNRVRKFWQHGIQTATSSLVNVRSQSLAQPIITQPNDASS